MATRSRPKPAPTPLELSPVTEATPAAPAQLPAVQAPAATPMVLLQMAVQQGADMDRLERLLALQKSWEAGEAAKAYNAAFAAFKDEAVRLIKNRVVSDGPLKGKSYAELFVVVNAVTPALSKHGLSASWKLTKDEKDWLEVTCTIKHSMGHSESVSMSGPPDTGGAKNLLMSRASTVTYLSRYTLKAILGLAEQNEDDDGAGGADTDKNSGDKGSATPPPPPPVYDEASFKKNLPSWRDLIQSGQKTAAQVINVAARKAPLTQSQQDQLRKLEPAPKRGGDFGDVLDEHGNPL